MCCRVRLVRTNGEAGRQCEAFVIFVVWGLVLLCWGDLAIASMSPSLESGFLFDRRHTHHSLLGSVGRVFFHRVVDLVTRFCLSLLLLLLSTNPAPGLQLAFHRSVSILELASYTCAKLSGGQLPIKRASQQSQWPTLYLQIPPGNHLLRRQVIQYRSSKERCLLCRMVVALVLQHRTARYPSGQAEQSPEIQ